jgi:sugar phosphate isomerase/epimerase
MEIGLVVMPDLEKSYKKGELHPKIEILKEAKVQRIEIHASFLENKKEKKLLELKKEFKEGGISISSLHAPFGEENDLSSPSLRIRKRTINEHNIIMEKMDIVEIPVLTLHPGSKVKKKEDILLRENFLRKSLEKLLPKAEKTNIKLAIENMLPMYVGNKTEALKQIIDEFSSPLLGVCFDTGHANVGEGVNEQFQVIKENIFDFHIHDNDGTRDMHLQPPYGNINWAEFFTHVESIGYKFPLMIEAFPWQGREISWMMKEVGMLKDNKILRREPPKEHFLRCKKCGHFIYGTESNPICYCNLKNS